MSVAAGTNGGTAYGAGKARFYYPNGVTNAACPTNMCLPSGLVSAYAWLTDPAQAVTTVNESFGCQALGFDSGAQLEGLIEDWYARHSDIAISKSAGNKGGCNNANEAACPYSLNSTCVGGNVLGGGAMSCFASFTNNNGSPLGTRTDREEPDISMFAGAGPGVSISPGCTICPVGNQTDVDLLNPAGGVTSWTPGWGTSFAAPAAATLTALCKEVAGGALGQKLVPSSRLRLGRGICATSTTH